MWGVIMANIIRKPLITEKNTVHGEGSTYVFEVEAKATKTDVKREVEKAFGVKVSEVRTMNCRDRARRTGNRTSAVKKWKKALVKVAKGEKIALFEGV
jgi:large subunit ribosomal protein L23